MNLPRAERKNPDLSYATFSYDCWIVGDIPDSFWQHAKLQDQLWNELVTYLEDCTKDYFVLSKEERASLTKEQKNKVFDNLNLKNYREIGKKYKGILSSQVYLNQIPEKFDLTVKIWKKNKEAGLPKKKYGLKNINIPVIYPGGTNDSSFVLENSTSRVGLKYTRNLSKLDSNYLINGKFCFGKNKEKLDLHVAYHRNLPKDAIIKKVCLVGVFNFPFGWSWKLQFSVEYKATKSKNPVFVAGFDPSWSFCDDYLHVGTFAVSNGQHIELRLPFSFANSETNKQYEYAIDKYHKTGIIRNILEIPERQALEDNCKEAAKKVLSALSEAPVASISGYPVEAIRMLTGLSKMGHRGLLKFLKLLRNAKIEDNVRCSLEEYYTQYVSYRRNIRGNQLKFTSFRKDLYNKIADWISNNFKSIAWEDTDLKNLQEKKHENKQLDESKKYKNLASHFLLRQTVENKMQKEGLEFIAINPYKTSQTCSICGGKIPKSNKQLVTCENSHKIDRDANASTNIMNKLELETGMSEELVMIPDYLMRYLHASPLTVDFKQHVMHAVQNYG